MATATFDPVNKIWQGLKLKPLYNSDQNVGYLILKVLQQTPDSVTQISADTGVSVTCQQMYDRSIKIAKYLTKSGLKEGDLVGLVAANTENLAPIVFACFTLGIPVNPLSPIMNEKDIVQMFSMTKPKMIFCDAGNVKVVQNAVDEMKSKVKILTVMDKVHGYECATEILKEMEAERIDDFTFPSIDSSSTAIILCSSGSTGFSKGICKSHKQILDIAYSFLEKPRGHKIIMFQTSSIFWISGFNVLIFGVLYKLLRITTAKPFDPFLIADVIHKYQVTDLITPPFAFVDLLQKSDLKPFTSIDNWFVGGMIVSQSLCERFKQFVPNGRIINGYGCTEENILTVNESTNYGSVGMVVENAELKVVDENGNALGPKQHGEIYCKIPVQFSGYFDHPEKTAEAFEGEWFKTGDIGYYDDAGYFYVVDRKKELMKYYNYQITSSEIETIIDEIDGIVSSCVVGVPDGETGNDIIHAFVIVDKSKGINENFVLDYVNKKVIDPKRIRGGVHIVDSFPLGLTQKVDRKAVREMAKNFYKK